MAISAEKLETAILAILHSYPGGRHDANMTGHYGWIQIVSEHLGQAVDYIDIQAALHRLDGAGFIVLTQFNPEMNARYTYQDGAVSDATFFGQWNFEAAITAAGRGVWDVPRSSNMGFKYA